MRYYIIQDEKGLWWWYLLGENNERLAQSFDSRQSKQQCYDEIALVKVSQDAEIQDLEGQTLKRTTD